jgi:glycosyltransferase involved in cell wall biosynthesis
MDLTVSPHATFYASPMKILEYMAMGKTVIAPAMDNIRDIVDDHSTGLLFEPGNGAALLATLRQAIDDRMLRRSLGTRARDRVVTRLNWRYNAQAIIDAATRLRTGLMASHAM